MNISKIFIVFVILLTGCNGNIQESKKESGTAATVKPCSREDVKKEVLSLFESKFKSIDSTYIGYSKILSDSLSDIFSNQKNENTCGCEASVYYSYSNKDYTSEQKKQLDSLDKLISINPSGDIHESSVKKYRQIHDNPKGWSEPKSSKDVIKYEVKVSDDGKTFVELYK
jgi:hypothetical protein